MKFKCDNLWLFVEGIQFRNGEYSTIDENEIEILNRYKDSVFIVEEIIESIIETKEVVKESIKEETKVEEPVKAKETKAKKK